MDKMFKGNFILDMNHKLKEDEHNSIECKTTDLLKDYTILHERIKVLYKILEIHRYISWYYQFDSIAIQNEKKSKWQMVGDTINIEVGTIINCKENVKNTSVRNNKIRDIKNEIKRYHRLQSNIQTVLNTVCEIGDVKAIHRQYNTEEVPSQFKNDMNYTYYVLLNR